MYMFDPFERTVFGRQIWEAALPPWTRLCISMYIHTYNYTTVYTDFWFLIRLMIDVEVRSTEWPKFNIIFCLRLLTVKTVVSCEWQNLGVEEASHDWQHNSEVRAEARFPIRPLAYSLAECRTYVWREGGPRCCVETLKFGALSNP
jgi:hypothetical protein